MTCDCGVRRIKAALATAALALIVIVGIGGMRPAAAEPIKLLVLGDSLAAGYGLTNPGRDSFTAQLQRALKARGIDATVINAGISGNTSKVALDRLAWVLASKPQYAIVELGGNDGLRGVDPAATKRNLDGIITRLKARGIKVLLAGMLAPRNLGPDYGKAFDAAYPALAKKHGVVFMPFFLKDVALQRELNQPDLIHPNAKGVAVIVRNIMPYVLKLLGRAPS